MFNFKKIKGTVNKATSAILTASLSLGIFSVAPVKAMESYSEDTTVVENEEVDREECWDPYTMLSNAEFILGDNHKDQIKELKEEFEKDRNAKFIQEYDIKNDDDGKKDCKEKSVEVTNQYKEELENKLYKLLNENEQKIYYVVKKFIIDEEADWHELINSFDSINYIKKEQNKSEDIKFSILKFNNEVGTEKTIVFILNNKDFSKEDANLIISELKGSETTLVDENNFKNVNLILRNDEYAVNCNISKKFPNSTLNLQGAKFEKYISISGGTFNASQSIFKERLLVSDGTFNAVKSRFDKTVDIYNSTFNDVGSYFNNDDNGDALSISNEVCINNSTFNNVGSYFDNNKVCINNSTFNGVGSYFDNEVSIKNSTFNGVKSYFDTKVSISQNSILIINNAKFGYYIVSKDSTIEIIDYEHEFDNLSFSEESKNIVLVVSKDKIQKFSESKISESKIFKNIIDFETFNKEKNIEKKRIKEECKQKTNNKKINEINNFNTNNKEEIININNYNNKTEELESLKQKIKDCQEELNNRIENLKNQFNNQKETENLGSELNKQTEELESLKQEIKDCQEELNNQIENLGNQFNNQEDLNKQIILLKQNLDKQKEDIERMNNELNKQKGNNNDIDNDINKTQENSENKNWKTLKRVGVFGLIVLEVVTSIVAFKDKIKSLFPSKKTIETPACKVKNPAI